MASPKTVDGVEQRWSLAEIQRQAYASGFEEGKRVTMLVVFQALGYEVRSAPQLADRESSSAPPAPASVAATPGPVCVRCGHSKEDHEPLASKSCYAFGCAGCKGFALKKGVFG